ncbi:MAG: hypothetical protein LBC17_00395 [Lactobacillaceae bacterium]|jgi:hypothetical protein|nr:hypothetical protein [Lactobacillaceae bacterium]
MIQKKEKMIKIKNKKESQIRINVYGLGFSLALGVAWFATNHNVIGTFWRGLLSWIYLAYYAAKMLGKA